MHDLMKVLEEYYENNLPHHPILDPAVEVEVREFLLRKQEGADLQKVCDKVGKQRLANLFGWTVRTLDRKLSGQHKITTINELAIRHIAECG